jgi:Second Messenger Oligonucleotide or Dinucleotide Synthetase domain
MPYSVTYSFEKLRENIEVSSYDRDVAAKRRDRLVTLLDNDFDILEAFTTGSLPKYTAVKGHADLDIIVALHFSKHIKDKMPSRVLQAVQESLSSYRTRVRRNGQAVTLFYDTWPNVDIVPASQIWDSAGNVVGYNIPDMNREIWLNSQPKKHAEAMTRKNELCGENFKRIVKMFKWWNHQHSSILESFHIEVLAMNTFTGSLSAYPWDIYQLLKGARESLDSSLWHDGIRIDDYLTYQGREDIKARLDTAVEKASAAWYKTYGTNEDDEGAIRLWRQIFGEEFPAYG